MWVCTIVVSGLITVGLPAVVCKVYAVVTGPVSASTASVPITAMILVAAASAAVGLSVTLPVASVRPWVSPVSHRLLLLRSMQTSALLISPSMTVVTTPGAAVDVVVVEPPPPPPQAVRVAMAAPIMLIRKAW